MYRRGVKDAGDLPIESPRGVFLLEAVEHDSVFSSIDEVVLADCIDTGEPEHCRAGRPIYNFSFV